MVSHTEILIGSISRYAPSTVLAGRGGLTNQHPGNEWFRRLVRCSRGFYRGCPKHTKMSVAKAIVRSVQSKSPPGRFLEQIAGPTGTMWKECEYQKTIDKSSQALREKWEATADDEVLKSSMQLMFDKKLETYGGWDGAERHEVEEAVYFAVTTVALEYAKRWGTKSFQNLTKGLLPIVSASKKGKAPAKAKAKKAEAASTKIVASINVNKPPPPPVATFPVEMPTATKISAEERAMAKNYADALASGRVPPSLVRASSAPRTSSAAQGAVPTSLPQRAVTSPPIQLFQQVGHRSFNFQNGVWNPGTFGSPLNRSNTSRTNTTRTGKPLPFSKNIVSANSTPIPPGSATKAPDTFGAPAPSQAVFNQRTKVDASNETSPLYPMRSKIYDDDIKATVSDESETSVTLGQTVSRVTPPVPTETKAAGAALQDLAAAPEYPSEEAPTPRRKRGRPRKDATVEEKDTDAKRKMNNIMTTKEIEEDIRKRPKNHGMSPFHQELLKMNLNSFMDW